MNAIDSPQIFFRSLATRAALGDTRAGTGCNRGCRAAGFDFIILETPGIGQGDAAITEVADLSLYVMTPEFGSASQLEKIDMLDLADVIAINKFDRRGAEDALRSVSRQWIRSHASSGTDINSTRSLARSLRDSTMKAPPRSTVLTRRTTRQGPRDERTSASASYLEGLHLFVTDRSGERIRYLAEIAATIRAYHLATEMQTSALRRMAEVDGVIDQLRERSNEIPKLSLN